MRRVFAAGLLLTLTACGFQLRQDFSFPPAMQATYVRYQGADGETLRAVVRALSLSDVPVVDSKAEATAILDIPSSIIRRRVTLKDTQGRPREYEVAVALRYSVQLPDGRFIVPSDEVTRRMNIELDPSDPLSRAGDLERAVESLREQVIWDMLQQISAAERNSEPSE